MIPKQLEPDEIKSLLSELDEMEIKVQTMKLPKTIKMPKTCIIILNLPLFLSNTIGYCRSNLESRGIKYDLKSLRWIIGVLSSKGF